jgi:hypothetical protein
MGRHNRAANTGGFSICARQVFAEQVDESPNAMWFQAGLHFINEREPARLGHLSLKRDRQQSAAAEADLSQRDGTIV